MSEILKKKLLERCIEKVQMKQERLQSTISDAQKSLESESQSTAGDKHDTGRAMMHLEIEKKSNQLSEIVKLKRVLNQIEPAKKNDKIGLGSIIESNNGWFFIAINGGKCSVDGIEFTIISLASPLAQHFSKAMLNKAFKVMNNQYVITKIF
ncbi:MAG: 3-oxoacyl-ACP synthase [Crocinitomicaceae bacterium]